MKTTIKIAIIIIALVLAGCIGYGFVQYGIPFLEAKSTYTKDIPTIEKQQLVIDSLQNKVLLLEGSLQQTEAASIMQQQMVKDTKKQNKVLQEKYRKIAEIFSKVPESQLDAFLKSFEEASNE